MCAKFFEGLFGGNQQAAAPAPVAVANVREKRASGQVKSEAEIASPTKNVSGGGNTSIGIAIGTPDTPRKRTTELGL
jgi:hypothetical protein